MNKDIWTLNGDIVFQPGAPRILNRAILILVQVFYARILDSFIYRYRSENTVSISSLQAENCKIIHNCFYKLKNPEPSTTKVENTQELQATDDGKEI